MAEPTGREILMWALTNRARLDPAGEAARYGIDLNEGPVRDFNGNVHTITTASKQPLAWNAALFAVADQHSADMRNANPPNGQLFHNNQATHEANLNAAGYSFSAWGENISQSATLSVSFTETQAIYAQHQSLFVDSQSASRGHRYNIMLDTYQELGVGQVASSEGATRSWITQDFGRPSAATQFLTGIAYNDNDGDKFYSASEGRGGISVAAAAGTVASGPAGYYSRAASVGAQTVTFSSGDLAAPVSVNITVAAGRNVLLNLVGQSTVETSVSLTAVSGVITIIGLGNLGLTLTGNAADNTIFSALGNDTLDGQDGTDSARFRGTRAQYTLTDLGSGSVRVVGPDGTDTVNNTERLVFDDQTVTWPPVAAVPDLTATTLTLQGATARFLVNNVGGAAAAASTTGMYLSTDAAITTGDTLLSTKATSSLAAGASNSESIALNFTPGPAVATYFVGAVADYNAQIGEGNEGNNASNAVRVILGTTASDSLSGTGGDDTLIGFEGNDIFDGGAGRDNFVGGVGDDQFFVDDTGDLVNEIIGQGIDRVWAVASYVLTPGAEIEILTTTNHAGTAGINLTGNGLAQLIVGNDGNNIIDGGGGADTLMGRSGDDQFFVGHAGTAVNESAGQGIDRVFASVSYTLTAGSAIETFTTNNHTGTTAINLTGNAFAQLIVGNDGNNIIDGGGGADTMMGRLGDDQFFVSNSGAAVVESAGQGIDRVFASVSYTLTAGSGIETFTTINHAGTSAMNLTGNEFSQFIMGNDGSNVINGGAGSDTLVSRAGSDTYLFNSALGPSNIDDLTDFNLGLDIFNIDDAVFAGLPLGTLAVSAFFNGSAAHDADDRIIYNGSTGALLFDADGSGGIAAQQFANIGTGFGIDHTYFIVV